MTRKEISKTDESVVIRADGGLEVQIVFDRSTWSTPGRTRVGLRLCLNRLPRTSGVQARDKKKSLLAESRLLVKVLHKVVALFVIFFHDVFQCLRVQFLERWVG